MPTVASPVNPGEGHSALMRGGPPRGKFRSVEVRLRREGALLALCRAPKR